MAECDGQWHAVTLSVTATSLAINVIAFLVVGLSLLGSILFPKASVISKPRNKADVVDVMELKHEDLAAVVDDVDEEGPSGSERPAREFIRSVLRRDSQGLLLGGATDALLAATDGQLAVREARPDDSGSVATGASHPLKQKKSWMSSFMGSSAGTLSVSGKARERLRRLHDTDILRILLLVCVGSKAIRDALILAGVAVDSPFRLAVMLLWTTHGVAGVSVLIVHLRHYSLVVGVSDPQADVDSLVCKGQYATLVAGLVMAFLQYGLDALSIVRTNMILQDSGEEAAVRVFAYYTAASFYSWTSLCFVLWAAFTLLSRKLLDLINRSIVLCKTRKQEEVSVAMTMLDYDHGEVMVATHAEGITMPGAATSIQEESTARPVTMAELLRGMDDPVEVPRSSTYGAQPEAHMSMFAASMRRASSTASSPAARAGQAASRSEDPKASTSGSSAEPPGRNVLCCCVRTPKARVGPLVGERPRVGAPRRADATPGAAAQQGEGGRPASSTTVGKGGRRHSAMERGVTKDVLTRVESHATMLGYRQATVREVLTALDSQLRALRRARQSVRTIMWTLGGFWGTVAAISLVMGTAQQMIRASPVFSGVMHAGFNLAAGLLVVVLFKTLIRHPARVLVPRMRSRLCRKRPVVKRIPSAPPRTLGMRKPAEPPRPPTLHAKAERRASGQSDSKMPFRSVSSRRLGEVPSMPTLHE